MKEVNNIINGTNNTIDNRNKIHSIDIKPFSIPASNTAERLKWFMYLTNTFGSPTDQYFGLFVANFSKSILNGNFILNINDKKHLENIWAEIKLTKGDGAIYTGGLDFYNELYGLKAKTEDEIKEFIINYRINTTDTVDYEAIIAGDAEEQVKSEDTPEYKIDKENTFKNSQLTVSKSVISRAKTYTDKVNKSKTGVYMEIPNSIKARLNTDTLRVLVTYCDNDELVLKGFNSFEELTFYYILSLLGLNQDEDKLTGIAAEKYIELIAKWQDSSGNKKLEHLYREE